MFFFTSSKHVRREHESESACTWKVLSPIKRHLKNRVRLPADSLFPANGIIMQHLSSSVIWAAQVTAGKVRRFVAE